MIVGMVQPSVFPGDVSYEPTEYGGTAPRDGVQRLVELVDPDGVPRELTPAERRGVDERAARAEAGVDPVTGLRGGA